MPLTILLADDSMTAQNMGKKILTEAGYEVIAVSNGAAAVKKIAERRPDLAVLDVYMPGYTGLEVCERIKNAHETTNLPVILTVGKMEPFKAEEGTRVKADGLIIKPFEASDLLAAIQKLQEKNAPKASVVATSHDPDELPPYERTVKMAAPVFDEQHDESYASWKSEAQEHVDENLPPTTTVPTGMQSSAAFAEELETAHPDIAQQPTAELNPAEELTSGAPDSGVFSKTKIAFGGAAIGDDSSLSMIADAAGATIRIPPPVDAASATVRITQPIAPLPTFETAPSAPEEHVDEFEKIQSYGATEVESASGAESAADPWSATPAPVELEPAASASSGFETGYQAAPEHVLEPTSAPKYEAEPDVRPAEGFEPTSPPSTHEVPAGAVDPALITDSAEMATAFPTKFGVENAEPVPVGNAADYPELYGSPSEESAEQYPTAIEMPAPAAEAAAFEPAAEVHDAEFEARVNAALQISWVAEETHLEQHEHGVMLHEEMQQQFSKAIAAIPPEPTQKMQAVAEPEVVHDEAAHAAEPVEPAPPAIVAQPENAPDHELAAAMAAAVGGAMEPAITEAMAQSAQLGPGESTMPLDQHTSIIAEVVHRVTERLKPELIAQISREVAEELAKKNRK